MDVRKNNSRAIGALPLALSVALATAILSIFLLISANNTGNHLDLDDAQLIIALTFVLVMTMLALSSLSKNMQICFQMTYIYFAIYLILPGFNHASNNEYPFDSMSYSSETRVEGALIVAIFCFTLALVQIFGGIFGSRTEPEPRSDISSPAANPLFLVILWVVLMASLAMFLAVAGASFAFSPRGSGSVIEGASGASATLVVTMPRAIAVASMAYAILQARLMRPLPAMLTIVMFFIPVAMLLYPPAIARFQLFGLILICVFSIFNFSKVSARFNLSMIFVFGAVIAMPVADMLTRGRRSISDISLTDIFQRYYASGDFDGFQSINNVVVLAQTIGFQYGRQILGSMLFFIPRDFWPAKPEPTGILAARNSGYTFLNISQPLPGEIYADFGLSGVGAAAAILALLFLRFDRWIDRNWLDSPEARLAAGAFVAYSTITLRGTLAAVIGPVAVVALLCVLIKWWGFRRVPVYVVPPLDAPQD